MLTSDCVKTTLEQPYLRKHQIFGTAFTTKLQLASYRHHHYCLSNVFDTNSE